MAGKNAANHFNPNAVTPLEGLEPGANIEGIRTLDHFEQWVVLLASGYEGRQLLYPAPKTQLTDDAEAKRLRFRMVGRPTIWYMGEGSVSDNWAGDNPKNHRIFRGREGYGEVVHGQLFQIEQAIVLAGISGQINKQFVVGVGAETMFVKAAFQDLNRRGNGPADIFNNSRQRAERLARWGIANATPAGLPTLGKGHR